MIVFLSLGDTMGTEISRYFDNIQCPESKENTFMCRGLLHENDLFPYFHTQATLQRQKT